jgi:uncharacterized membrane protein YdjX (TVP38/TMEM64 family)
MISELITKTIETFQRSKWMQILLLVILIIITLFLSISLDVEKIKDFLRQNQNQAIFIGIMIYFLLGFTFIPTSPLTLFFSVFLGPIQAVLIATSGNLINALLAYQLGKAFIPQKQLKKLESYLPEKIRKFPIASPIFLIISRLFPIGKRGISYLCGAHNVPFFRYLWTSGLFYIVSSALLAFGGFGLTKLF